MLYGIIISVLLVVIFFGILIPLAIINDKYIDFVLHHSVALKQLEEINKQYDFINIPSMNMYNSYDNENMFSDITCKDYLTYQLVFDRNDVLKAMEDTLDNKKRYEEYNRQIKSTCVFGQYDCEKILKNKAKLDKIEKKIFNEKIKHPTVKFFIVVELALTAINGYDRDSKVDIFHPAEIKDIIKRLSYKRGYFYLDNEIWQSICRVERGKVSNKMRFAIYERDNYRCQICGRSTDDLEIDHIIPISKGGKSTYSNLQTLCHRCNARKGSSIVNNH